MKRQAKFGQCSVSIIVVSFLFLFGIKDSYALKEVIQLENNQPLKLLGVGLHSILKDDIYIGALYVPQPIKTRKDLINTSVPKRMSFKIVSNRFPKHRISRMWKESIAMNSKREKWLKFGEQILQFTDVFDTALVAGDRVDIDFIPGVGMKLFINEVAFFEYADADFFQLFLNTWVGPLPPNKTFRNSILGQGAEASVQRQSLMSRAGAISMTVGRIKPKPSTVLAENATENEANNAGEGAKSDEKRNQPPAPPTRVEPSKKVVKAKPDDKSSKVDNKAKQRQKAEALAKREKEKAAQEKRRQQLKARLEQLARDRDLMRGSFKRKLIGALRKHQKYPSKAWRQGLTGDAIISVTIDRSGEVIDTSFVERTGKSLLDRAVLSMVKKASPLPKIPEQLAENRFEFKVPVIFAKEVKK